MSELKNYKFNFELSIINDFKRIMIENDRVMLGDDNYLQIHVAIDRIRELTSGLNKKILIKNDNELAYDFYEVISQGMVVINAIEILSDIISSNSMNCKTKYMTNIKTHTIDGCDECSTGDDYYYMKYIRSLCSEHPILTNRSMYCGGKQHFCSSVMWSPHDDDNLWAERSTSKEIDILKINIKQIIAYIEHCYSQIKWMGKCLISYIDERVKKFRYTLISSPDGFPNYIDYLDMLIDEKKKRLGGDTGAIEYVKKVLSTNVSEENKEKYDLYVKMLKKAIEFEHNQIQQVSDDEYECRGVDEKGTSLLLEIVYCNNMSWSDKISSIREKMELLVRPLSSYTGTDNPTQSEVHFASHLQSEDKKFFRETLKMSDNFFSKYVIIDDTKRDDEVFILINMALLFDLLDSEKDKYREIQNL